MSTRGAFGFLIEGRLKVGYNHCDSYPCGRGAEFAQSLGELSPERLRGVVQRLVLLPKIPYDAAGLNLGALGPTLADGLERFVQESPESPQAERIKAGIGSKPLAFWLDSLRAGDASEADCLRFVEELAEANASASNSGSGLWTDGFPVMKDSSGFLKDSLMCEWAWIANLDEGVLEVYRGFNQNPRAPGRYAAERHRETSAYCGVRLAERIPFSWLRASANLGVWAEAFNSLDKYCDEEIAQEWAEEHEGDPGTGMWLALRESWALEGAIPIVESSQRARQI